jgi:hypothetical protein
MICRSQARNNSVLCLDLEWLVVCHMLDLCHYHDESDIKTQSETTPAIKRPSQQIKKPSQRRDELLKYYQKHS